MIISIDKIIVKDRIRQDFGDLKELADDIQQNGLISPPVVNKNYELLAGERRLRACESLGWKQIEVRMMDTRDAEHELNVEISENDVRKGFSKSERVDLMKRLFRIEQAKAKERQNLGLKSDKGSRSDNDTAKRFNIGRDTMRKEFFIVDNKDLLTPEDFADWDEDRLSTNKAFQMAKKEKLKAENENVQLREELTKLKAETSTQRDKFYKSRIEQLSQENKELRDKNSEKIEVIPPDYEDLKQQVSSLTARNKNLEEQNNKLNSSIINKDEEITRRDEEITHLRSKHSHIIREADAAYDFWVKVNSFTKTTLAPFHYDEIVTNNQDNSSGDYIIEACNLLIEAATDILKRFKTEIIDVR